MEKKVGIVTFNDAFNYGALLQEYALQYFLTKKSIHVISLNYRNDMFEQSYAFHNNIVKCRGIRNKVVILYSLLCHPKVYQARIRKNKLFKDFIENEITATQPFKNVQDIDQQAYDYFLSGSDQVWNVGLTKHNLYYLLNFVTDPSKKISYAASFGRVNFTKNDIGIFKKELGSFKQLLVREKSGQDLLAQHCGLDADVVLDPTLLLNRDAWEKLASKSHRNKQQDEKYVLVYTVDPPYLLHEVALKYARQHNFKIIFVGYDKNINVNGEKIQTKIDCGPYEFVDYFLNAEMVFTNSFHGTIFSINLNIPFYYELSRKKINNNARITDIINKLNIENREISSNELPTDSRIDWQNVNRILAEERQDSKNKLMNMLE